MRKFGFKQSVLKIVSKIPKGRVLTYKKVAKLAGRPKASRAVGNILNKNYDPKIPCHRVIRSDGRAGGHNRGPETKIRILKKEGYCFDFRLNNVKISSRSLKRHSRS